MDFIAIITYLAAIVETAALIGALAFITRAMKSGKNSPEKKSQTRKAVIFFLVYLVLNVLRSCGYGL